MNGTLGKEFKCKRGVRQGDLLSPLIFAIVADLLQCAINHEYDNGTLVPPFPQSADSPFPVIQYANDTILIMKVEESQLVLLMETLLKIEQPSGLKVNYHKSCLVPINVEQNKISEMANTFGCIVGYFPFTYLELPMGKTKPLVKDYAPLIFRIERHMSATSQFHSYVG